MTDIGLLVRSANPVPDDSQQLTDDELSAILLLAQQRSGEMDTKERAETIASPASRRRNIVIAAGAFAVVIAVVGGLVLATRAPAERPPTTAPSTTQPVTSTTEPPTSTTQPESSTTTAPPELDAGAVAYIEALVAELNAGDHEAVAARYASARQLGSSDSPNSILEGLSNFMYFWVELDSRVEIAGCRTQSTGITRCDIERYSEFDPHAPMPETSYFLLRLEGDVPAYFDLQALWDDPWGAIYEDFQDWVAENYPQDAVIIFGYADPPLAAERQKALVDEYREQAGLNG